MKADLNFTVLTGRLTKDAEVVKSAKNVTYTRFCIATNSLEKSGTQYVEYTSFYNLKLFGKFAEAVLPYLTKGQQVEIECTLKQSRWESNGEKKSSITLNVRDLHLIGNSKKSQNSIQDNPVQTEEPPVDMEIESSIPNFDIF